MNPTTSPRFDPDEATPIPSKAPSLSGLEKDNQRASESTQSGSVGLPRSETIRSAATAVNEKAQYTGSGTPEDPYIVDWAPGDPQNPFNWSPAKRWRITAILALTTLCIAFASSSYSGGLQFMMAELHMSQYVGILGISLYVVGFGLGPLVWGPLSEMYGRRLIFMISFLPFVLLHLGGALAHNIPTLLVTRFLAGSFGSSPLTNAGGTIADMFTAKERGLASALFAMAPFAGPVLGPIVGGYVSESRAGWRWNFWIMFIFSAVMFVLSVSFVPETFAPVLLRRRARELHAESEGKLHYVSKYEKGNKKSFGEIMKINLSRPFVLLFREPIVLLFSIYTALIYGTLYGLFAAFPVVFQRGRHFSPGEGGLAFLGVGLGIIIATACTPISNKIYYRAMEKGNGVAPPEARLVMACVGAILLPISMTWFAWTTYPSVHYIVPIIAGVPFGAGMLFVFTSVISYLIDSYTLYAASALAANAVLRSIMGAAFPLFTPRMYASLGDQWACMVFAFLALACTPMPFLFYRFGPAIRARSKFSVSPPSGNPVPQAIERELEREAEVEAEKRHTDARSAA
ncbi:major facilitator superfamily transporter [Rhizoctonia solani]|uniref:Major facilitator superfamily transporter n=1 Tax=Rhizoctonia solani TaxID=456999 RepID=A0A8H8SS74_9AGAM|nr:major facilitator superfamily transporter [Rhizoctonia solani]QRW16511.1 major facilitator superfamily transporter [Rhizoctonia solani]